MPALAPQPPFTHSLIQLLDHLVGEGEDRLRHREAERLRRLQIDEQLELRRLLHRQFRRFRPFEDLVDVCRRLSVLRREIGSVRGKAAGEDGIAKRINARQAVLRRRTYRRLQTQPVDEPDRGIGAGTDRALEGALLSSAWRISRTGCRSICKARAAVSA